MRKIRKLFRCIRNYFFCKKYPFWKLTNDWYNYNTSLTDKRKGSKNFFIKYNHTWYDDIPCGWRKAFGKQLSKDIKKAGMAYLKKGKKWSEILQWQQIKEKWGELCLYASAIKEIRDILDKYEYLSIGYCINCGKPARYITKGWVEFYCKDCFIQAQGEKYLQECRLTKKDIPVVHTYHKTLNGNIITRKINLKKKYGIDFKKLWDLK